MHSDMRPTALHDGATTSRDCVTCGTAGSGQYCSACGQDQHVGRHTFRTLVLGTVGRLFNAERGLGYTAAQLTKQPGVAIRGYITGRTARYVHPASYLIIGAGAFALSNSVFGSPTGAAESDKLFTLVMIPIIAAASRALDWRGRLNFAEHLIVVLYLSGHVLLSLSVLYLPVPLLDESAAAFYVMAALLASAAYFIWGYGQALAAGRGKSMFVGAMALVLGAVAWIGVVTLLVGLLRR